jgi:hypothetical protein
MRSQFIVAPNWPDTVTIKMLTSNLAADGLNLNANPSDANWYITNVTGDTILSRTNTNYSTLYADTVILPRNGYYKFTVSTPGFCAGLHWWLYDQVVTGYMPGYLQVKKLTNVNIPMHGYVYATSTTSSGLKNLGEHDDFGCSYSQYFYVSSIKGLRIPSIKSASAVAIYPNPANEEISIDFGITDHTGSTVTLINMLGQTVYSTKVSSNIVTINSRSFAPGVYSVLCTSSYGSNSIGKVVVSH